LIRLRPKAALATTRMADVIPVNRFAPFDPDRVREIIHAFDEACRSLAEQPPSDYARSVLAKRITELAQQGEWDVARLRDDALAYLKSSPRDES
jgi:hypothetical protein